MDAPGTDAETAATVLKSFLCQRCYEATQWAASDGEERRLALWIYDEQAKLIRYFFSNEITDKASIAATFALGEGLIGAAFSEGRMLNVSRSWQQPAYKPIQPGLERLYNGLLLIPILYGDHKIGMLSVDRTKANVFRTTKFASSKASPRLLPPQ